MKKNVGPVAILAALALLGVLAFVLYRATGPSSNLAPYETPKWHGPTEADLNKGTNNGGSQPNAAPAGTRKP